MIGALPVAITLMCVSLILPAVSLAEKDTALAIMQRSEARTKAQTEKATYRMELIDEKGAMRERKMALYFKQYREKEITLLKFTAPASVNGAGLLLEDSGRALNDIWSYLPATRRLRRIAGQQKRNWFLGTEFTYEDFEDYKIPFYSFTLIKRAQRGDGCECFVIEARANAPEEVEATGYSRKVYWIEQASYYPVKIELFDKGGKLWKIYRSEELRELGQYYRPQVQTMHNLKNDRRTRLVELDRELDSSLDGYYVSSRFLRAR